MPNAGRGNNYTLQLHPGICIIGEHAMPLRAIITSAFACLALALPAMPARADCVDDCQAATYCDSTMYASGECNDKLNQCYQLECNKSTEAFGAIAYGPDSQAFGYSYDSARCQFGVERCHDQLQEAWR